MRNNPNLKFIQRGAVMVNSGRLADCFSRLVTIDSVSREEGWIASELSDILKDMGAGVYFDNAGEALGGECGNLVAKFKGSVKAEPLFLCGHMDTVEPGRGVKPSFEDGIFKSDGTTILGADDKSALAIIIEVLKVIFENNLPHPPIEVVFTICEEIGLLGAKHFDLSLLESRIGYILDSTETDGIVTKAPAAGKFTIRVHGRDAHAGAAPEHGINAISLAAKAMASFEFGRIDHETTCNIGLIHGGKATNIVPDLVTIEGEARSHDQKKLDRVTGTIFKSFYDAADEIRKDNETVPDIEVDYAHDFSATNIDEDHIVVRLARKAAANLGRPMESKTIGGGADANVFCAKGITAGVLGTGMQDVHTLRESIKLSDMVETAELVLEIIRVHAHGEI